MWLSTKIAKTGAAALSLVFLSGCGEEVRHEPYDITTKRVDAYTPYVDFRYYSPGSGTDPGISEQGDLYFFGRDFPSDMVVGAAGSNIVFYLRKNGKVAWIKESRGGWLDVQGGRVFYPDREEKDRVKVVSLSGKHIRDIQLEDRLMFFNVSSDHVVVGYSDPDKGVDVYEWNGSMGKHLFTSTKTAYPRWAEMRNGKLAIADTFNHRVLFVDINTGKESEYPFYFPNDVDWLDGDLLVTEEHMNRLVELDAKSGQRKVVMAPEDTVFDSLVGWKDIDQEKYLCPTGLEPRSIASDVCSGINTLYSPNGAEYLSPGIVVAGSDNSRIVYIEEGKVQSSLNGVNGPSKIALVP